MGSARGTHGDYFLPVRLTISGCRCGGQPSHACNPLRKGGAYCLQAKVFHTDGTRKNYRTCLAKRTHDWQRRKTTFTIAKDYNKIVVYLLYYKQGDRAWFDDVRPVAH